MIATAAAEPGVVARGCRVALCKISQVFDGLQDPRVNALCLSLLSFLPLFLWCLHIGLGDLDFFEEDRVRVFVVSDVLVDCVDDLLLLALDHVQVILYCVDLVLVVGDPFIGLERLEVLLELQLIIARLLVLLHLIQVEYILYGYVVRVEAAGRLVAGAAAAHKVMRVRAALAVCVAARVFFVLLIVLLVLSLLLRAPLGQLLRERLLNALAAARGVIVVCACFPVRVATIDGGRVVGVWLRVSLAEVRVVAVRFRVKVRVILCFLLLLVLLPVRFLCPLLRLFLSLRLF